MRFDLFPWTLAVISVFDYSWLMVIPTGLANMCLHAMCPLFQTWHDGMQTHIGQACGYTDATAVAVGVSTVSFFCLSFCVPP